MDAMDWHLAEVFDFFLGKQTSPYASTDQINSKFTNMSPEIEMSDDYYVSAISGFGYVNDWFLFTC